MKYSGFVSSVVFVGLFAIMIYFCCRVKRKGAVIRRDNNGNGNSTNIITHTGQSQQHRSPNDFVGYPYSCPPPTGGGGVYAPTTATPYPPATFVAMPMPAAFHNPPYPTAPVYEDKPPAYEDVVRQQQ